MSDELRAGIIGAGFIGMVHAHAVRAAGGIVRRAAASTPERSLDAAGRLGAEGAAATAEELIDAEDVDVVHICAPNSRHAELALRAIAAGKHLICEKPLAVHLEGARRLAEAAARADVVATVPFVYRFYPTVREARVRLAAGEGGPLRLVHGSYLQDWQAAGAPAGWRGEPGEGGEIRAFIDIGVHWCDLVEFVSGQRIARLVADITDGGRQSSVQFRTDGGAAGSVVVSQVSPGRKNRLAFSLETHELSYSFNQEEPETLTIGGVDETRHLQRGAGAAGRLSVLPPGHPQGYQDCFNAFVSDSYAAIGGDQPEGLPGFDDGVRAAALTHAVGESARVGRWVEVPS
ncbi:oxidoreductase domain protein (plasmid) [Pseudonocardia dioxanivorans CB1190]|uniref:Oxidoreductase domain protein n=1 Tax=Pseudonocardia dioxanivorans (strain ATCC 55486 / DSM 44775 / JCM 13855 / CB1190) TaxID=675635 RepID=F2L733_PSEUX|nr:Gfo/Idh/MocA family oxidoreductase [Pseudonocardia dioxanivorans]AEA29006.1 oxidoreductase domain protein [Pseudonocardia dioxanivorans CB1190]